MPNEDSSVAIVTGASKGFGRAVTGALIASGWSVIGDARHPEPLLTAAEELGASFQALPGDVTDEAHLMELVALAEQTGRLCLVVNNAGSLGPSPLPALADVPVGEFGPLFEANVFAPLRLIQLSLPSLRRNNGSIVNVTSDAVPEHYEGWGAYGASKAALEKITGVLATELPDIRVYSLDPGDMQTDMQQEAFPGEDISDRAEPSSSAPAVVRLLAERAPSGRYRSADLR